MLSDPEQHIDDLFDAIYQLLFYDQTDMALATLRRAWPAIRDSAGGLQWVVDEFEEVLLSLTLAHYAAVTPKRFCMLTIEQQRKRHAMGVKVSDASAPVQPLMDGYTTARSRGRGVLVRRYSDGSLVTAQRA